MNFQQDNDLCLWRFSLAHDAFFRWSKTTFLPKLHKGIFLAKKKYSTYFLPTFFFAKNKIRGAPTSFGFDIKSWKIRENLFTLLLNDAGNFKLTIYKMSRKFCEKWSKIVKVCLHPTKYYRTPSIWRIVFKMENRIRQKIPKVSRIVKKSWKFVYIVRSKIVNRFLRFDGLFLRRKMRKKTPLKNLKILRMTKNR